MPPAVVLAISAAIVGYSIVSRRARRSFVTPAMVFMGLGLLVAQGVPGGLPRGVQGALVAALAELTLVVVLYTDASRINLPLLWREHGLPNGHGDVPLPAVLDLAGGSAGNAGGSYGCIPGSSGRHQLPGSSPNSSDD